MEVIIEVVVKVGGGSRNNPFFFNLQERLPVDVKGPQLFHALLESSIVHKPMCLWGMRAPPRFADNRSTVQFCL